MQSNRRDFFKTATAAIAAAPIFIPKSAWGANDRIAYGVIAPGGRGRYLNERFQKLGAQCVALCDVYEPNLQAAQQQSPDAKTYIDYHELLEQWDPEYWRQLFTEEAAQFDKLIVAFNAEVAAS